MRCHEGDAAQNVSQIVTSYFYEAHFSMATLLRGRTMAVKMMFVMSMRMMSIMVGFCLRVLLLESMARVCPDIALPTTGENNSLLLRSHIRRGLPEMTAEVTPPTRSWSLVSMVRSSSAISCSLERTVRTTGYCQTQR